MQSSAQRRSVDVCMYFVRQVHKVRSGGSSCGPQKRAGRRRDLGTLRTPDNGAGTVCEQCSNHSIRLPILLILQFVSISQVPFHAVANLLLRRTVPVWQVTDKTRVHQVKEAPCHLCVKERQVLGSYVSVTHGQDDVLSITSHW